MMLEKWNLQNVKVMSIYLILVLIAVPRLFSFPNYTELEKKGANVHNMVKNDLISINLSL